MASHPIETRATALATGAVAELPPDCQHLVAPILRTLALGSLLWERAVLAVAYGWPVTPEVAAPTLAAARFYFTAACMIDAVADAEVAVPAIPTTLNSALLLMGMAQRLLLRLPQPASAIDLFSQAMLNATNGQFRDGILRKGIEEGSWCLAETTITEEQWLDVARLKTGAPIAAVCIGLAVQASEVSATERESLHEFGLNIGVVHQIDNDIGALRPDAMHKRDLANGQMSLPLIFLRDTCHPDQFQAVLDAARQDDLVARHALFALLDTCGALHYARTIADYHSDLAYQHLAHCLRGQGVQQALLHDTSAA